MVPFTTTKRFLLGSAFLLHLIRITGVASKKLYDVTGGITAVAQWRQKNVNRRYSLSGLNLILSRKESGGKGHIIERRRSRENRISLARKSTLFQLDRKRDDVMCIAISFLWYYKSKVVYLTYQISHAIFILQI